MNCTCYTLSGQLAVVLLLVACSTLGAHSMPVVGASGDLQDLLVVVAGVGVGMLPGVEVILLARGEETLLGTTSELGTVTIPRGRVATNEPYVILFCAEGFFCGAWRAKTSSPEGYDEIYIELAPFAVR